MKTTDELIAEVLDREIHRDDRGKPWAMVPARLHPADRGGWTRAGITARSWGEYAKLGRPATVDELNNITEADRQRFYRDRYVEPLAFLAEPLKGLCVDWAITSGHDDPAKAVQDTLKRRGVYAGQIDGIIGPLTRSALVHDPEPRRTYADVFAARVRFYVNLGFDADVRQFLRDHPGSQLHNVRGWVNRALEFAL